MISLIRKTMRHSLLPRFLLLVFMLGIVSCAPAPRPRHNPLTHSAYVWRQGWTAEAVASLTECKLPEPLSALNVLVGECGLSRGPRAINPPWKELSGHGRAITLSVRIGTRKAIVGKDEIDLSEGFGLLMSGLAQAKAADVQVESLQLDFDCPERLLRAYAEQINILKTDSRGLPLTITTLPSWLDAADFDKLIAATDGWTLQLHSTSRPKLDRKNHLFSANQAEAWTNRAMRFGKPFRVALPTYAYLACFGKRGEYLGMHAEQSGFPAGTLRTIALPADPAEVSAYLRILDDGRYGQISGVDWFRLPLSGDRQNWTMRGFGDILAGRTLSAQPDVITTQKGELYDLSVRNTTDQPLVLPSVNAKWNQGHVVGVDATYAWRTEVRAKAIRFACHDFTEFIAPGEQRVVGWLRLSEPQTLTTEISK